MNAKILEILNYDSEGPNLDYKKESYGLGKHPKRNEFLKDIMSFANHPSNDDKFIIVGVKDKNGVASEYHELADILDDANYQDFIINNITPKINFEFKTFEFKGKTLGYFRVSNNFERPYLFKKNIINPISGKTEFREGDGYIRSGTSSKKMVREDFEMIYSKRFMETDRKSDVSIIGIVGVPDERELYEFGFRYIDVCIENHSNKSLSFEAQLKVYKSNNNDLVCEDDANEIIYQAKKEMGNLPRLSVMGLSPSAPLVYFENHEDYVVLSNSSKLIPRIAQHDKINDLFKQHLLVRIKRMEPIKGLITIRSDEFSEGPLILDLQFDIPEISI